MIAHYLKDIYYYDGPQAGLLENKDKKFVAVAIPCDEQEEYLFHAVEINDSEFDILSQTGTEDVTLLSRVFYEQDRKHYLFDYLDISKDGMISIVRVNLKNLPEEWLMGQTTNSQEPDEALVAKMRELLKRAIHDEMMRGGWTAHATWDKALHDIIALVRRSS